MAGLAWRLPVFLHLNAKAVRGRSPQGRYCITRAIALAGYVHSTPVSKSFRFVICTVYPPLWWQATLENPNPTTQMNYEKLRVEFRLCGILLVPRGRLAKLRIAGRKNKNPAHHSLPIWGFLVFSLATNLLLVLGLREDSAPHKCMTYLECMHTTRLTSGGETIQS